MLRLCVHYASNSEYQTQNCDERKTTRSKAQTRVPSSHVADSAFNRNQMLTSQSAVSRQTRVVDRHAQ